MPSLCPLAGGSMEPTKMDKHGIITRDKPLLFNSSGTPADCDQINPDATATGGLLILS